MGDIVLTGGLSELFGRNDSAEDFDVAGFFMAQVGDGVADAGEPGRFIALFLELGVENGEVVVVVVVVVGL